MVKKIATLYFPLFISLQLLQDLSYSSAPATVITSVFVDTYPFYYWPENITIADEDTTLDLLCMVHGCNNGPFLVIGGCYFSPDHGELVESQCKLRPPNSRHEDGIWFLRIKSTLNTIRNYSECSLGVDVVVAGDDLISVSCRTAFNESIGSYIHIKAKYENAATDPMKATNDSMNTEGASNDENTGQSEASKVSQNAPSITVLILSLLMVIIFTVYR